MGVDTHELGRLRHRLRALEQIVNRGHGNEATSTEISALREEIDGARYATYEEILKRIPPDDESDSGFI